MTQFEQEQASKKFAEEWKNKGDEKSDTHSFWLSLLRNIYGVEEPEKFIEFEKRVLIDNKSFIDAYIPSTKVLIEQKSNYKDLNKPEVQSDGSTLTPYEQAKRYSDNLDYSERARWIITCNFKEFQIFDMDKAHSAPTIIKLEELEKQYYVLQFIVDSKDINIQKEEEVSFKAGELVGKIYDEIVKLYIDPTSEESQKSLNMLCVRLVFCLYAEDAGLFGRHSMFHDYIQEFGGDDLREALINLFKVLDTPEDKRDPYLKENLAQFPYVNGGLFANEDIEIPRLNDSIKSLLVNEASQDFDWSEISPTIFGAVFESTLNPETRRKGGMHYTSIENIHKVIDPLFLNELKYELDKIIAEPVIKKKRKQLEDYQNKLASLKFLDPACGSGNFLTETYLSIRKLENRAIEEYNQGQILLGEANNPIKVSIQQFYGIEINDFAVTVAKTALWIAESQMYKETQKIITLKEDFLPLKTYTHITEGNALRIDWNDVLPSSECNYIMGNPPFVGARLMSKEQKEDVFNIFNDVKNNGNLDYVSCWYKKCSDFMKNTNIRTALVSTNSICQGEQVPILWKNLLNEGIIINFAYKTFRWDSEATLKAHVHCVIIGFSYAENKEKFIFEENKTIKSKNINAYLIDAPNIFIENRVKPLCDVPKMDFGNMPNDGGYLSNYSKEDKEEICNEYPKAEKLFRRILGAEEFINNKERYCLWLKDIEPSEYKDIKPIINAIDKVRELRENSKRNATKKLAITPYLFGEIRQPNTNYLLIPRHSSQIRKYIPIGYIDKKIICGDSNMLISSPALIAFGILSSNVHNSWMRAICGRIKSDYRYSAKIVYNNFPWPTPTENQKEKIEKTAQKILDIRAKYPNSSLADLYNPLTMPKDLFIAHKNNDAAVMEAYEFNWRKMSEADCVAELFKMYEEKINKNYYNNME